MNPQKFDASKKKKSSSSSIDSRMGRNPDSRPFFEHGNITVPNYDFDFSQFLDSQNIKPVKFGHDNQSFAKFVYHPLAPFRMLRIANCDSDYISSSLSKQSDDHLSQFNFLVCYAAARQILETLNHRDKVTYDNLFQKLCSPISLPKIWSDYIKCLGNKTSPYGTIDLLNPVQAILDFVTSGIISLDDMQTDKLEKSFRNVCKSKYPKDAETLSMLFREIRKREIGVYHIYTKCAESINFAKTVARMYWKEITKESIIIDVNGTKTSVQLPDIDDLLSTADGKTVINNFRGLKIGDRKQEELLALIEIAVQGHSKFKHPDFHFDYQIEVDVHLQRMLVCCFDMVCSSGQSTLKRIYETQEFIPSKNGSSAQLVIFNDENQKYSTKINLSRYPQALGSILMVTKEVIVVRQKYTTYTDLNMKDSRAFLAKDAANFYPT